MSLTTAGGPVILPSGQIADPDNANHRNVLTSSAPAQETRSRLVTRRTPVNFTVCCLIDLIQRENARENAIRAGRRWGKTMLQTPIEPEPEPESEPYDGQDEADRPPRG